ncbi:protealysin inhibitor emfourin [Pseudomonas sp. RIT-PI-AD]|uniref:protealysin inhibitor emfourin n=1 Tax=Pseudomonas sp. RIT-PI-AD TaxID=3035294 RepID=UPI0021DAA3FE|nr:protealysin inhibitor emfourin [Pseudomonas sp. RIT-PI-AD]
MSRLPPLGPSTVVRLWREGGVAFLPARAQPKAIVFAECSETERQAICRILEVSAQQAKAHEGQAGRGDQRYFRIEVQLNDQDADDTLDLRVPETQAPESLVKLWRERQD